MIPLPAPLITWVVFAFVYVGLAVGKLPLLRLDRAGIALVGATAALVTGIVDFDQAVGAVDYRTIALLFGMMVVVAYLRLGGLFGRAGAFIGRAHSPHGALALVVGLAGVLSAFLVNDVVCLALGPVVLGVARRLRRSPVPYLVALATSANIGSAATVTGNPQNMIIGTLSHLPYAAFAVHLAPVAVLGLVIDYVVVAVAFRDTLRREDAAPDHDEHRLVDCPVHAPCHDPPVDAVEARPPNELVPAVPDDPAGEPNPALLPKGVIVLAGVVALFFVGVPIEVAALGAAAVLLLGRVRPDRIYRQIDWSLLVMFAGLFVVVFAFESHVVSHWDLSRLVSSAHTPIVELTVAAAALSNLVSNVPAVLLAKSLVESLAPATRPTGWLALGMASTLSGNLTPVASVANLIVLEGARRQGVRIALRDYCRVGIPVTLLTLVVGAAWLGSVH